MGSMCSVFSVLRVLTSTLNSDASPTNLGRPTAHKFVSHTFYLQNYELKDSNFL
jgi:hypothetical protein